MENILEHYHYIWLNEHPNRTQEWLKDKFKDGFHIHHIDGNHDNNDNTNLVLIEGADHFLIHNKKKRPLYSLINSSKRESRLRKKLWITPCQFYYIKLYKREDMDIIFKSLEGIANFYHIYRHRLLSIKQLNDRELAHYNIK